MADDPAAELSVIVVALNGDAKDAVALAGETVEQFVQRLGEDKGNAFDECVVLLHDDHVLPLDRSLHDCGVPSGATLTLFRERLSQLRLTAVFYGDDSGESQPLWIDECSPGKYFCHDAAAWCFKFQQYSTEGACGAVCFLENPGQMQRLVDDGKLSKTEAVRGILACFIRSLLAVGRIGTHSGRDGIGDPRDNEMASSILRENLHRVACGADVLLNWSTAAQKYAELSQTYLEYVRKHDATNFGAWREHVTRGFKQGCKLDECEEISMALLNDSDEDLLDWKELLEQLVRPCECSGSSRTCDECCKQEWVSFLRHVSRPGNIWFQIQHNMGDSSDFDGFAGGMYKFAGGVYVGNEVVEQNQLPPYYIVQWAMAEF